MEKIYVAFMVSQDCEEHHEIFLGAFKKLQDAKWRLRGNEWTENINDYGETEWSTPNRKYIIKEIDLH